MIDKWNVVPVYSKMFLGLTGLEQEYAVVCVRCHASYQTSQCNSTPESIIDSAKQYHWRLTHNGPICDECAKVK